MRVSNETKVGALTVIAVTLMILGFNFLKGKTFFKSGTFIYAKYADTKGLIVALDDIRDPGNLGTIIRLCDWFGVTQLLCSTETVDVYNPKVIQATMGSITRVKVNYVNLNDYISQSSLPVFGTFMDGKNLYKEVLPKEAILIFGNEANGISASLEKNIKNRIAIPRFPSEEGDTSCDNIQKTESLNVATATAIFLSEFRRNG